MEHDDTTNDTTSNDDTSDLTVESSVRDVPAEEQNNVSVHWATATAVVATLVLLASIGIAQFRNDDPATAASTPTDPVLDTTPVPESTEPNISVAASAPPTTASAVASTRSVPAPSSHPVTSVTPPPPPAPTPPAPSAIPVSPIDDTPAAVTPPVAPPPNPPPFEPPPPVVPPAPSGKLIAQAEYALDPGVDAVSVALANQGEVALAYEIVNDGEGFAADVPTGEIAPGDASDVWIQLAITSEGDGPTVFERAIQIESDGGDAVVTVVGQVEKPGFVVAEFESLPLVDYRATVRFTNVGGLPVEIIGVESPGLEHAPVPQEIAANETLELDIAICATGETLPIFAPHPQPVPQPPSFTIGSWVSIETRSGPDAESEVATTTLMAHVPAFTPLDCTPVVDVPTGDIALSLG